MEETGKPRAAETPRPRATASLRSLGVALVDALGTRAELAVVELREAGERGKEMIGLALVCAIFAHAGLLVAAFLVVVIFWDTHRIGALVAVATVYLAVAAYSYAKLRGLQRDGPPLLEATLRELEADREMLRGKNE